MGATTLDMRVDSDVTALPVSYVHARDDKYTG
jgi:hypothetical protein